MTEDPFTSDEREAQRRAGFASSGAAIRKFMPDQHREFFPLLRYVFLATANEDGSPAATVLTGDTGFVTSPTPTTLRIATFPPVTDPSLMNFSEGHRIGILGLDLSTRRRNRANGSIREISDRDIVVDIEESFGNCPQYIQRRIVERCSRPEPPNAVKFDGLPEYAATLVAAADTFFVATLARADLGKGGLDISHRGGKPGFVRVAGRRLSIPDFRGNRYFNTLGNLLGEPRVALLFVDYLAGHMLHLQGRASIDWTIGGSSPVGAERIWHVDVECGWWRSGALDLTWHYHDESAVTSATGTWPAVSAE
jgi:uncharacterized protein